MRTEKYPITEWEFQQKKKGTKAQLFSSIIFVNNLKYKNDINIKIEKNNKS